MSVILKVFIPKKAVASTSKEGKQRRSLRSGAERQAAAAAPPSRNSNAISVKGFQHIWSLPLVFI
jgi:hypothetical protein